MESKGAKDGAELSFLAIVVLVNDHVDLEHLADGIPEVSGLVEAPVVQQVQYLRQVLIVWWAQALFEHTRDLAHLLFVENP